MKKLFTSLLLLGALMTPTFAQDTAASNMPPLNSDGSCVYVFSNIEDAIKKTLDDGSGNGAEVTDKEALAHLATLVGLDPAIVTRGAVIMFGGYIFAGLEVNGCVTAPIIIGTYTDPNAPSGPVATIPGT